VSLLEVTDLSVAFPTDTERVAAVRGMNFHVDPGEVVALVGESGAGKSASAMAVVGLLPEYAEISGSIRLHGKELVGLADEQMSRIRGKTIGTVFQDPMSALTPVYTVGDQIAEALRVHNRDTDRRAARTRAVELLELVGIAQPERRARSFPHELSGGERQRVVIAIAIANDPRVIIADEPTTALDVTTQRQYLNQSIQDWYNRLAEIPPQPRPIATNVYQCHVDRFSLLMATQLAGAVLFTQQSRPRHAALVPSD
jgi:ABC-type glutathione transport system ATPase component